MSFEETRTIRDASSASGEALRCATCDHAITEHAYRTEVSGSHAHTFVNPSGFAYAIGCFAAAPGCATAGSAETAFSWFPGWSWTIAICARCHTQLGWRYQLGTQEFHGLILAALR